MTSPNFWELAHVSDQGLRHGLLDLIGGRCRMEARIVAHLAAIEQRRLHLVDGFSSMFDFCLRQLGLSESEAYHRIAAARVARQFPVVFGMTDRGEIHLSAICLLRDHLSEANHLELLQGASGKTKLQVQELLVRRFPKPPVEDSVRKLPSPRVTTVSTPPSASPTELPRVAPPEPTRPLRPAKIEPVADAVYKIQFAVSRQFKEKLDLARALSSHENPTGKLEVILEQALALWLDKVQKRRFAKTDKPRGSRAAHIRLRQPVGRREHIANSVRREVAARDELQCTYRSPNGERCAARAFLEFHHEQPWARRGRSAARLARAKQSSRLPRAESHAAAHKLGCARSAARLAPQRAPNSPAACRERSRTPLRTNLGARAAPHASRPSARQTVQPPARKFVELADLGTIRSRSTKEMEAYENRPNGRMRLLSKARSAQRLPADTPQT